MKRGRNTTVHFVPKNPILISTVLEQHFHLSSEKTNELFALGAVYCNKQRVLQDKELTKQDSLQVHLQPKRYPTESIDWKSIVVEDTPNFWIINKPAGVPVHATNDNLKENVGFALSQSMGHAAFITQRLDTPVSGLMLIAKNERYQRHFNEMLAAGKIKKHYTALVEKAPALGKHRHFMEPSEKVPRQMSAVPKPKWQKCELTIHKMQETIILGGKLNYALEVELHTGRTHQIRCQLAAMGSPLLGDKLYGGKRLSLIPRSQIALCATQLAWVEGSQKYQFTLSADFKQRFSR